MNRITASICEMQFMGLRNIKDEPFPRSFVMEVYFAQRLGLARLGGLSFHLAEGETKQLRQAEGVLPCIYLAVGPVVKILPSIYPKLAEKGERHIIIDCGILLDIGNEDCEPFFTKEPEPPFGEGVWMAALGVIHTALATPDPSLNYPCMIQSVSTVDMRPHSTEFGRIIPWEIDRNLPHDPDVIRLPSVFATFDLYDCISDRHNDT
ncbi:MAG: hypothetical protein ACYC27_12990 [Armatimonadota bacterium]